MTEIFIGAGAFFAGFITASLIGSRHEDNARADGYHAGVREGRQWARLKKLNQEAGE